MNAAENLDSLARTNAPLKERLMRIAPCTGKFETVLPGLLVTRYDELTENVNHFYDPSISVVIQGDKHTIIGSESYRYGAGACLVNGVDMPSLNSTIYATADRPFLAASLAIDRELTTKLNAEIPAGAVTAGHTFSGMSVAPVAPDLLDAFSRLFELLERPDQLPVLAPMAVREIHFRALIGPQGGCLRQICTQGSQTGQVAEAVSWLRANFTKEIHINELADLVSMATSTFHRQFKKVTSLSPLQFQKRLRLYEAQRLMLTEDQDATSASLAVGYESPTQFNREYKRLFGTPPHRDISRMRQEHRQT